MRGFFDLLQSSVKQSRQRMYLVPPVFAQLTEQHEAVLNAILAGDADAARKAMMAHLGFVKHRGDTALGIERGAFTDWPLAQNNDFLV
jgi:DNA-binding FadR family transcriptional regulator